ncbi:hypothetical protein MNBD_NITROSPIRAE01-2363 [hydrothermal vent metagenome]|uniref:HTH hxlR-type domain-containing protein n=1 Tax=hydrothermal vent metagenome TaxID=652676 RepID=A0A3B1CW57_9ZZZZ
MKTKEKKNSIHQSTLPVSTMLENIVGCKWSLRVMQLIWQETNRPGEMQRHTPGLSTKVLNERLNKLMRFGILKKTIFPVTPPHVEYHLTPFGKKFSTLLDQIEALQKEIEQT